MSFDLQLQVIRDYLTSNAITIEQEEEPSKSAVRLHVVTSAGKHQTLTVQLLFLQKRSLQQIAQYCSTANIAGVLEADGGAHIAEMLPE